MRCRIRAFALHVVCCAASATTSIDAQGNVASGRPDVLGLETFQQRVLANHPELAQIRNEQAQARQQITVAKGAFDPKFSAALTNKRFRNEPYYAATDLALSVPTFFGADFKLGFERGVGARINPERETSSGGLLTLGVSMPLARNLITDERRTLLSRARAWSAIADAEAITVTNNLLLRATKAYAEWYLAYRKFVIADSSVRLAEFRLESVKARIQAGENAPIDSIEAQLEVRRRRVMILEAQNEERIAALDAVAFLWNTNGLPERVSASAKPAIPLFPETATDTTALGTWLNDARRVHPAVLKAEGKMALEAADWRLNAQGLLPNVDVSVAALSKGDAVNPLLQPSIWDNNYKSAVTGSTSLLLRKERGKLQASALKVESARLERDLEQRRVAIEIQNALSALVMLEAAVQLQRENVGSAALLRDAEEARFVSGESTLLSVNLRERFLLDEVIKLEQFNAKILSARVALATARGIPAR